MRLRRLQITRFRGIQSLDWRLDSPTTCLVGPNDSGKTTILDAIELVLWPRWTAPLDDTDFHNGDTSNPIVIKATVGSIPAQLIREDKFGMHLQGWPPAWEAITSTERPVEPDDDHEDVLVIQLTVESDLEPKWMVVDAKGGHTHIGHRDREHVGVARIGALLDRHLGWGRGSVLSRLTADSTEVCGQLANASRAARSSVQPEELPALNAAATKAQEADKDVGVKPANTYQPRIDLTGISMTSAVLTLHDGNIPLRRAGEGSRRLLTLAMQRQVAMASLGCVTLVDEVEHGLEPFRLRQVLRVLRGKAPGRLQTAGKTKSNDQSEPHQLVMTSHSPIALAELEPGEIAVVRRRPETGVVRVKTVGADLAQVARGIPDALVSPKVLLCEGKTEIGFARALDSKWTEETGASFAYRGVATVDGGGSSLAARALGLLNLEYVVICFLDSDDATIDPELPKLQAAGATIIRWNDSASIELRLINDLPWEGVIEMVAYAMEDREPTAVANAVAAKIKPETPRICLGADPQKWKAEHADEQALRAAFGQAAKNKNNAWFKRVDHGEVLGQIALKYRKEVEAKDLGQKLALLRQAIHGV